jgi:hypothetical protein
MLRPRYWETTAVQELRAHAAQLARHLAAGTGVIAAALCRRAWVVRWSDGLRTDGRGRLGAHLGVGLAVQKILLAPQTPPVAP